VTQAQASNDKLYPEKKSELRVAIRYVTWLAVLQVDQGHDDVAQDTERLVDAARLSEPDARRAFVSMTFGTGQVDEVQNRLLHFRHVAWQHENGK